MAVDWNWLGSKAFREWDDYSIDEKKSRSLDVVSIWESHFSQKRREVGHPHFTFAYENCAVIRKAAAAVPYTPFGRWRMSDRNSDRVSSSSRKTPSIDDVTAAECCFSTPRIIMQRWRASITTPTPCG